MKFSKQIIPILFLLFLIENINGQNSTLPDEYFQIAENFRKNTQPDSAIAYYKKAAVEFQALGKSEKFIDSYNQIGIVLTRQDKYKEAKAYLDTALAVGYASLDSNHLSIATTYISLGVIYNAEGNYEQSLENHLKSLEIRLFKLGENDAQIATSYGNIGNVYRNNKNLEKSIEAHLKAMEIRAKLFGENSPEISESYVGLGNAYKEKKEYSVSLNYFEKALKNKIIQRGEGHKDLAKFYKYLSEVSYLMDDKKQGDFYKSKQEAVGKN